MGRKIKLAPEEQPTNKTTLADSPEATKELTDIKPHEVSVVDFPANGEPFFVMKSLKKDKVEKLCRKSVPLEKMKDLHDRLVFIKKNLELVNQVVDKSEVKKSVSDEDPKILKSIFKNVIDTFKTIKGEEVTDPLTVTNVEEITKQYTDLEKGNAISFVSRDRYAYVTQSVSEYVTTYLDGIEHDDDGPMLIPLGLDSGVEDSLEKMEDVIDDDVDDEKDTTKYVSSSDILLLKEEISSLKSQINDANVIDSDVNKKGSKVSKDRLKKLKSIANDIGNANEQMIGLLDDLDSTEQSEEKKMSDKVENTEKETEKSVEETNDQTEQSALVKGFNALCEKLDSKFEEIEKNMNDRFENLETAQKENKKEIEKFASFRVDSRADTEEETPVTKFEEDVREEKASFKNILGL